MAKKLIDFISSLKLTVICLVLAMILVFVGTLAQVELGLYEAQQRFFRHFLVYWNPPGTEWRIPVLPGGWLLGTVLLVNLIAAHLRRFKLSWKKSGILLTHFGLIFLLLGQFFTELLQVESAMRIAEGEEANYSVNQHRNELVLIDTSGSSNRVYAIPESRLQAGQTIADPRLPFEVRVKRYAPNSRLVRSPGGHRIQEERLDFEPLPRARKMDDLNLPSAVVELVKEGRSLGEWLVSTNLEEPQMFEDEAEGKRYLLALRFERYYKPFSLRLIDFRHDRYLGTSIPKNYSSEVEIHDPAKNERRTVRIYMNNPLRTHGETYYQASFVGEDVTVLQVVRNPAWLTPYIACVLVGLGLLVQFSMHLYGFIGRRAAPKPAPVEPPAPAVAGGGKRRKA